MIKKYSFALGVYSLVFFLVAFVITKLTNDGFGVVISSLIVANSTAVFLVSIVRSYRYGIDFIHTIMMAVLYVLSVYVVFNNSALDYLYFYIVIDFIGLGVGRLLRKIIK